MNKTILVTGAVFGMLAVLLGAFGAHGFEKLMDAKSIQTFETGVTYQMYHAFFLLVLGSSKQLSEQSKKLIFYCIALGIVLFSCSIYFLATNSLTGFDFKVIAFVTPIGGSLLILGWILLGYRIFTYLD